MTATTPAPRTGGADRAADPAPPRARRRRHASRGGAVLTYLVLGALFVVVLFPVYYAVAGSLMGPRDINAFPPALVPADGLHPENYGRALDLIPLVRQYGNSVAVAAIVTVGQVVTSVLAAYAFVFLPLRAPRFWFGLFLATMMVPWEAIIIPNYLFMSSVGLIDTWAALSLPFLATGFGAFLLRQAFLAFPTELRDAARVDGAGHLRFLWSVLVPLSRPTLAALGIYAFLSTWNMYFWPLLVTRRPESQTIQIGITQLQSVDSGDPGMVLAGVVLALLPTVLLVLFGQRFIVRGLTAGAVK
ncbi:carbohydrate ABC transporter permease [Thalassiella azotivora]